LKEDEKKKKLFDEILARNVKMCDASVYRVRLHFKTRRWKKDFPPKEKRESWTEFQAK